MDGTCRLCSSRSRSTTSIFDSKNDKLIADLITTICPIKIGISDDLPKRICSLCLRIITEAVELREKSIVTDQDLRRRLSGQDSQNSKKSSNDYDENPVKLEKEANLINFIDQSLVSHEDFHEYEDNEDDDNSGYMNYDVSINHDIVDYEPPAKMQKHYLKRTIEEDIDSMTDIAELKSVMKTFHKRLIKVEHLLHSPQDEIIEPHQQHRQPQRHHRQPQPPPPEIKRGSFLMNKISTVPEFEKFVEDISLSKELRDYLVSYWKVIPHGSRQSPENGKVYAILLSLFDEDFLYNHVKWGHGTKKEYTKDNQSDDTSTKTIILKTVDHFLDMIKEALGLQTDANAQIATIFKNLFRNKIKRQMIKGTNPTEVQHVQPTIAQAMNDVQM
ncbi:uncharacterized protein [Chironomus tepperi]|uniref:uncharacterized protein n=1 Tax=Chironomus tepperi TaxID=113505 RepID=UPI00391F9E12